MSRAASMSLLLNLACGVAGAFGASAPVKLVETGSALPGGHTVTSLDGVNGVSAGDGDVAFTAGSSTGPAVYLWHEGVFTLVADSSTSVPGGSGETFSAFGYPVAAAGAVTFMGNTTTSQGIYSTRGGTLAMVARSGVTPAPGHGGEPFSGMWAPGFDGVNVAFVGGTAAGNGVYLDNGSTLVEVGAPGQLVPGQPGVLFDAFAGLPGTLGLDDGRIGALAWYPGGSGTYHGDSEDLAVVADHLTPVPGRVENLLFAAENPSVDQCYVAMNGMGPSDTVAFPIFLWTPSSFVPVVDGTQPVPSGTGTFSSIGGRTFAVSRGAVAFVASAASPSRGLYLWDDGVLSKLVAAGDVLDGRMVSDLAISTTSFDGSLLAFHATFADSSQALFVLDTEVAPLPDADADGHATVCDCDDSDLGLWATDRCGLCGGDGTSCPLFADDFESGDATGWITVEGEPR